MVNYVKREAVEWTFILIFRLISLHLYLDF
jgi:hypothetical protein